MRTSCLHLKQGLESTKQAAAKLEETATDPSLVGWQRYGATRALNSLRVSLEDQGGDAELELSAQLLEKLKAIKNSETNEQLRSFYEQLLPNIRP